MRRIGIAVALLAAASWLVMENTSEAGRHHRCARCGSYSSGCGSYSNGCGTGGGCYSGGYYSGGCDTGCGSGCADEAVPAVESAGQPDTPPPPPQPDAGAATDGAKSPKSSVESTTSPTPVASYSYSRPVRRGLFRR